MSRTVNGELRKDELKSYSGTQLFKVCMKNMQLAGFEKKTCLRRGMPSSHSRKSYEEAAFWRKKLAERHRISTGTAPGYCVSKKERDSVAI